MQMVKIFSEFVAEKIKDYLPLEYQKADCQVETLAGNNGSEQVGLNLCMPGEEVGRTVCMETYYDKMKAGVPMAQVMGEIATLIQSGKNMKNLLQENLIGNFQAIKPYLTISLINTQANRRKLFYMPHMEIEDLSMICRIDDHGQGSVSTIEVMDAHLKQWGISKEALFGEALKNLWKSEDFILEEVASKCENLIFGCKEPENLLQIPDDAIVEPKEILYCLTNHAHVRGAAAVLCPGVMEKVCRLFPEGVYIIPSSIHEVMIFSKDAGINLKEMEETVRSTNLMLVKKEEILSDHLYEYDRDTRKICRVPETAEKKREMER